jgi:hypothetical protein
VATNAYILNISTIIKAPYIGQLLSDTLNYSHEGMAEVYKLSVLEDIIRTLTHEWLNLDIPFMVPTRGVPKTISSSLLKTTLFSIYQSNIEIKHLTGVYSVAIFIINDNLHVLLNYR